MKPLLSHIRFWTLAVALVFVAAVSVNAETGARVVKYSKEDIVPVHANPIPPTYCYLKPYYNDPNQSYFKQLEEGVL